MAITLLQTPDQVQPAYNQMIFVAESTETAQPSFNYIVYIKDGATILSRLKIAADPNGRCVVDIHKHVESLVDFSFDLDTTTTIQDDSDWYSTYTVSIDEEYLVGSVLTEFSGVDTSLQTYNGVVGWVEQADYNYSDYNIAINGVSRLYTSLPQTGFSTDLNSKMYLKSYLFGDYIGASNNRLEIKAYTNSGLDWTEVITIPFATNNTYAVGPANINTSTETSGTNFLTINNTYYTLQYKNDGNSASGVPCTFSGSLEAITTSTIEMNNNLFNTPSQFIIGNTYTFINQNPSDFNGTYGITNVEPVVLNNYSVTLTKDTADLTPASSSGISGTYSYDNLDAESLLYRIDLNHECSSYENYNLMFMDRLGSFIPINFNLASSVSGRITKTSYKKSVGSYANNKWSYSTSDRVKSRVNTVVNKTTTVTSNWINEEQSVLIDEMLASPQVYHINEDGLMLAIDILTSSYKVKQRKIDKIFNYQLEFEYSFRDPQQK